MMTKAFICGVMGHDLTADERAFLAEHKPWGFILFARNVDTPEQVAALCASLREAVGVANAPVLVDQEGGRVQRFRPPHWHDYPSAASLSGLYGIDAQKGMRAVWLMSRLHAFDLLEMGITVNCLPVLDVPVAGAHDVIGTRAYGHSADQVTVLGGAAAEGLMAGGVMPVVKHMPGHGRAGADSHYELPVVDATRRELERTDFEPFRALNHLSMAMTAHVVFSAIDPDLPATQSRSLVDDIIRGHIGFDGLLMSDDVSMQALSGDFATRTQAIFDAGCDIVLHCNGEMHEMVQVAAAVPELQGKALERAHRAIDGIGMVDDMDEAQCRDEFAALTADLPTI